MIHSVAVVHFFDVRQSDSCYTEAAAQRQQRASPEKEQLPVAHGDSTITVLFLYSALEADI